MEKQEWELSRYEPGKGTRVLGRYPGKTVALAALQSAVKAARSNGEGRFTKTSQMTYENGRIVYHIRPIPASRSRDNALPAPRELRREPDGDVLFA
jgi:hypothetical protein